MPGWDIYSGGRERSLDSISFLPDTTIGKKHYKRLLYKESRPEYNFLYHETQYWICNGEVVPLMHIEKSFEKIFPGCTLEKKVMQQLMPPELLSDSSSFILERSYLTDEERKIFEHWAKNAQATQLPVRTKKDALIQHRWPLKYLHHPYVKEMMEWESKRAVQKD